MKNSLGMIIEFLTEQKNEIQTFQECMDDLKKYIQRRNNSRTQLRQLIDTYNALVVMQPENKHLQTKKQVHQEGMQPQSKQVAQTK